MDVLKCNTRKSPTRGRALDQTPGDDGLLCGLRSHLGNGSLHRLHSFLCEVAEELTDLGRMCDKALEGLFREVCLDRDGLVERLDADKLLERGRVRLELLLGVIGNFAGNRFKALRHRAKIPEGSVETLLPEF